MTQPPKTRVTILSRPDCHLCTVVEKMTRRLESELHLAVVKLNVDDEPTWQQRYGPHIPVVLVDDVEACRGRVSEGELRRVLERTAKKARWRRPISRILSRLSAKLRQG